MTQFAAMGDIDLTNLARIDTSGLGAGPVVIRGGNLYLDDSEILAQTTRTGSIQAGTIDITTSERIKITNLGLISSSTFDRGEGGSVNVTTDSLFIDGMGLKAFTGIFADAKRGSTGNGGNVAVLAQALSIVGGGQIAAATFSSGRGGGLTIHAGSLSIDGSTAPDLFTGLSAATEGTGNAGNVSVTVDDTLSLFGGGEISAASSTSAAAGSVQLRLGILSMYSGSSISSANTGSGEAGSVFIETTGPVQP